MPFPPIVYFSEVGLIKGFNLQDKCPVLISNLEHQHVCAICWHSQESILVGTGSGIVFKQEFGGECSRVVEDVGDSTGVTSLLTTDNMLCIVYNGGAVKIYDPEKFHKLSELQTSGNVSAARLERNLLAVGGKNANLTLWDLEKPENAVFCAKNVRPTTLQLQVPVWISDICFVPNHSGQILLTASRYGELALYDTRCGQRRPVSRHAWRMSRKYGKVKVGTCSHSAIIPDFYCTRPITRALAFGEAPGVGIRVVAGNTIGDLCFLDMRLPTQAIGYASTGDEDDDAKITPHHFKSRGARAPEAPVAVRTLLGASGSITGLVAGGAGYANFPLANPCAAVNSQPVLIASSLDRYLRIYNRDTGCRLAKLYAKVPINSFLVSDLADFTHVDRLSGNSEESVKNTGAENEDESNDSAAEQEFEELWTQMESVDEVQSNSSPKRKKPKRKRKSC
ncbi:WD repeat-containing protein 74 [Paragonimus westermani]|uniref:WD repeat-containing protein 74 n=1 Tax=Paragonimus westermani TaxID=34504 RepID=A0A8T0D739_9TREM|nr:WD repeat-containing protein 74 [Paragonimus westermani]